GAPQPSSIPRTRIAAAAQSGNLCELCGKQAWKAPRSAVITRTAPLRAEADLGNPASTNPEKPMSVLDKVLDRIDQDLDRSLDRLFSLLRIRSISTDPAYRDECRQAAEHLAKDLGTLGFDVSIRPTAGHPVVVGKGGNGPGPRALFYGHYDVQPVDPLDLWETSPFEPRIKNLGAGRKAIVARDSRSEEHTTELQSRAQIVSAAAPEKKALPQSSGRGPNSRNTLDDTVTPP